MALFALLACLCAGVPTPERSFRAATVVFEGVVVGKRVVLHHDANDIWRPRHFAAGRRYVVYALPEGWKRPLRDLDCGTSHLVRKPDDAMGPPLATFPEPSELAPPSAPWWYAQRAYLVAGIALLLDLPNRHSDSEDAPTALAGAGVLLALVPLVGVCTSFGRGRRAAVLLVLAMAVLATCLSTAGRLAIGHPQQPSELIWPMAYTYPPQFDQ